MPSLLPVSARGQAIAIEASPKLRLMPWKDAVRQTRDALSGMAIARLVANLT